MDIVEKLRIELASLPKGYISNKTIGGKVRHYLQWTENGKIKSRYIKKVGRSFYKSGTYLPLNEEPASV